jgi:hypothetical protein
MDNKPKIDLKARLGKKTVQGRVGGPSIPPPVGLRGPGTPGLPTGMAQQIQGLGQSPSSPPVVDPNNPYTAISAAQAPVASAPAAIKIEMGEEIIEARKKGRSKVMILCGVTAGIGMVLGFAVGGLNEKSNRASQALTAAGALIKDVEASAVQVQALADVLKAVGTKLGEGKYPEEEVNKLGGIDIPFDGLNLAGKPITMFKPGLVNQLLKYAGTASEVDDQKDKIKRLLAGSREAITELLSDKDNPKIRWSVVVQAGPVGPWASMQPVPEPFLVKAENNTWPSEFKIKDGDQTVTLKRYTKGEPPTSGNSFEFIPVVPQTQALVCPADTGMRLRREVGEMEKLLKGDPTPGIDKEGLITLGDKILEELKKIGTAGG